MNNEILKHGPFRYVVPQIHVTRPVLEGLRAAFAASSHDKIYRALRFHPRSKRDREIRATAVRFKEMELARDRENVQSTKYRVQSTKYKVQNTEY